MNIESIKLEMFVERDINPAIVFSNSGKILYLNNSAETLLAYVKKQVLFDMALAYAPSSFGHKTTMLAIAYDSFNFYAINVGYEDENQISLHLYRAAPNKLVENINLDKLVATDINILLRANIALFEVDSNTRIKLLIDQDIPQFKVDQNNLSKLLRKCFESFAQSPFVDITLKMIIGKHIVIKGQKETLANLIIVSSRRSVETDDLLESIASKSHIKFISTNETVKLEIPLISQQ